MSKRIITISREFGSGGRTIGKEVAQKLGYSYYDKELVRQVAVETGFDEKYIEQEGEHAPVKSMLAYAFAARGTQGVMNGMSANDFLWVIQRKVILDLAEKGPCIIVGRCADHILRDMKPFRLFIYADMEARIVRCRAKGEDAARMSDEELRQRILSIDKKRARYYQFYTDQVWGDKINYDLCINTSAVNIKKLAGITASLIRER